jgi:hypothetical protein
MLGCWRLVDIERKVATLFALPGVLIVASGASFRACTQMFGLINPDVWSYRVTRHEQDTRVSTGHKQLVKGINSCAMGIGIITTPL